VRIAVRESAGVPLSGALPHCPDDPLADAVDRVADGLRYKAALKEFARTLDSLSTDQCVDIDASANHMMFTRSRGAYVLGLVVGLRLAGVVR
jgi:hypothetical protein